MDQKTVPTHIAVLMDGNRRWAKERGLPILEGHRKVANEILEPLIEAAAKRGIKYMTFWAFSTENWNRAEGEVKGIMAIFRHVISKRWQRLHEKGVRIKVIGDISKFPKDISDALVKVVEQTKENKKITVIFALNYGGRDEMIRAMNKVSSIKYQVSSETFGEFLDTNGIPDPEMIVRTGGEQRLSGFLLWQCQYSELYFPSWYMPEFTEEKLDEVIEEYQKRNRRFGK
ncbi:MAG: Di-trans,poly-cis-decaprenylcistransferase [uncultured bacterium]|nr:MAG: Di-trans,poly-cis-decaprenylcistransferase [uncultured bacterium]